MFLADSFANPAFSWDLLADWNDMTQYAYMRNALMAGAIVAVLGAVVGWFAILRSETYAAHTLSVIGFPGASGAALLGVSPLGGYFAFCICGALSIPWLTGQTNAGNRRGESAAIGSIQALALALGLLFISLYHGYLNGIGTFLFGSFTGITRAQVVTLAIVAIATLGAINVVHRRLIFASVDPEAASANGISVRRTEVAFLLMLGLAVAEASQFTGALLAFTLTVTPAAISQTITIRPILSMAIAVGIGVAIAWFGLMAAYYSSYPVGFFVTTAAFVLYLVARAIKR